MELLMRKNKHVSVVDMNRNQLEKWLYNQYGFFMSKSAYDFFYKYLHNSKPSHIMHWSEDRGEVFIRFVDIKEAAAIEYQVSRGELSPSRWINVPILNDFEGVERPDFHLVNMIRQELRKSLGMF